MLLHIWTQGKIGTHGALLYLFLAVAGISSLWYTSCAVLISTNRHQRVATYYLIACILNLPLAYVLLKALGLDGAALWLVLLEAFMLVAVLRRSLPAAHEKLRSWVAAIAAPPVELTRVRPSRSRRLAQEAAQINGARRNASSATPRSSVAEPAAQDVRR